MPTNIASHVKARAVAPDTERARWLAPAAAAAVALSGRALQIDNGAYDVRAVGLIALTLALALFAVVGSRQERFALLDARIVPLLVTAGLFANIVQLASSRTLLSTPFNDGTSLFFQRGVVALAVIGAVVVWGMPKPLKPWHVLGVVAALVAVHFSLGVLAIHAAPEPGIDVHIFQRESISALHSRHNPYRLTFPNIYHDDAFYGPGLSVQGRLMFGYPYPPLSLLLAMPAQIFAHDFRFAQLVAMELAAILMAFARPSRFGLMAGALYLTTPRVFFVLEQSWTEPFLVLGLAAVVFAACRNGRAVPWLFGAFLVLKQYLVFAAPAGLLLLWPFGVRNIVRFALRAAVAGLAITLPFILWDPGAFWRSVVALQFYQPFRIDALSFLAWWVRLGHPPPGPWVPFVAATIVLLLLLWRAPRTAAGFSATVAVTFLVFFAFNKQAFCNYYFFVVGAFAITLAAVRPVERVG